MADVTTISLETCAREAQSGLARTRASEREWIEGTLQTAAALYEARRQLANDIAFGRWCNDNNLGETVISKDKRAALVQIGSNVDAWRERLAKTESRSLRLIVAKAKEEEEVSQGLRNLAPRHQTKPGPKPKAARKKAKAGTAWFTPAQTAEYGRLDPKVQYEIAAGKRPPPDDHSETAPPEADPPHIEHEPGFLPGAAERLAADLAKLREEHRALTAKFETPSPGSVDIRLLVEKLQPLFGEIKVQSTRHVGLLDTATLRIVAGQGQKLLDQWSAGVDTVRRVSGHVRPDKMNVVGEALNAVASDALRDALEEISSLKAPSRGAKPNADIEGVQRKLADAERQLADADEEFRELQAERAGERAALAREGVTVVKRPRGEGYAVEGLGRVSKTEETMVSVHVVIDALVPLLDKIVENSHKHIVFTPMELIRMDVEEARRFIDRWASDDPTVRRSRRGHAVPSKASAKTK